MCAACLSNNQEDMDALTLYVDTITKAMQGSIAITLHYALEE